MALHEDFPKDKYQILDPAIPGFKFYKRINYV